MIRSETVGLVELFFIAVGLAMDAFAVSIGKGLGMHRLDLRQAAVIALFFGGFQMLMPIIGWLLGAQFANLVTSVAHWIAFAVLAFIGGKMIRDALREDEDSGGAESGTAVSSGGNGKASGVGLSLDMRELFMLAIATSIDALAVGVSFAFLDVAVLPAATLIGVVTFVISFGGVAIGHQFGSRWEKLSSIAGGVILILIGVKVVVDHFMSVLAG